MKNLTTKQAAEKIGKAKSTLLNYVTTGYFPKPKNNGISTFWEENVVDAWIILSSKSRATLPEISVDDLEEIQACVATISKNR